MKRIFIDGDSIGNLSRIEGIAKQYHIPVILYCNSNHLIESEYTDVRYVEKGHDKADFAIINHCHSGDIVITRDYPLAAMVLSKNAICLHPNGAEYNNSNIELLLLRRHLKKKYNQHAKKEWFPINSFHGDGIINALSKKLSSYKAR